MTTVDLLLLRMHVSTILLHMLMSWTITTMLTPWCHDFAILSRFYSNHHGDTNQLGGLSTGMLVYCLEH